MEIRCSSEKEGGCFSRGFKPPVEAPPVLVSGIKICHANRLEERFIVVQSSRNSSVLSLEKKAGV